MIFNLSYSVIQWKWSVYDIVPQCTWYVNFNLSYSAIQWKWSNYDIGSYSVQGMLILIYRIKLDGGYGRIIILVILAPTVNRA